MFGLKTLAVAGGGVAALAWAMNAHASSSIGDTTGGTGNAASISPNSARPGQTVSILYPGCNERLIGGTAKSSVFQGGEVKLNANQQGGGLIGTATITSNAQNGQWTVDLTCGVIGKFNPDVTTMTVYGGYSPTTYQPSQVYPDKGPVAGGGGSVMRGDMGMTAGGLALVAGGVGYGVWSMRRREAGSGAHVG
jgi:hypothetical protein